MGQPLITTGLVYLVVDHVGGGDEGAPKAVVVVVEVVVVVVLEKV